MPIKTENKSRYPANWRAIRAAILERAGDCCEFCGRPNHVWAVKSGAWCWEKEQMEAVALPGERVYRLVLTIAHLDHQPENCAPENLRALCRRCHLAYDAEHHQRTAYQTRRAGNALGDLFDAHL